jgi:predicted nucleic acid-binding protein
MTVYLDSNAWISVREHSGFKEFLMDTLGGKLALFLGQQVVMEMLATERVNPTNLERNRALLGAFEADAIPDQVVVLDNGMLDKASFGGKAPTFAFDRHLSTKTKKFKATADAIHLANVVSTQATLVTCDKQLRSSARHEGVEVICLRDFAKLIDAHILIACGSQSCPKVP